jgi:hypothetical protein
MIRGTDVVVQVYAEVCQKTIGTDMAAEIHPFVPFDTKTGESDSCRRASTDRVEDCGTAYRSGWHGGMDADHIHRPMEQGCLYY